MFLYTDSSYFWTSPFLDSLAAEYPDVVTLQLICGWGCAFDRQMFPKDTNDSLILKVQCYIQGDTAFAPMRV